MTGWPQLRGEIRPLLRLAVPIVSGELGWMAMGIVDTMMLGRLSKEAMGAGSVGGVLFYTFAVFGTGLLLGLETLVSQAFGARDAGRCHRSLIDGLWLSLGVGPVLMMVTLALGPMLPAFGVQPAVASQAAAYLSAVSWSMVPLLLYSAFRRYLQSMNLVKPVVFSLVSANLVNFGANYALIFGHWGLPALGAAGAGWATTVSRLYMAAILAGFAWRHEAGLREVTKRLDMHGIRVLWRLGLPAALQMTLEVGVFALGATLIGGLAPVQLAAHQVAISAASTSFMIPLGLGSAAAVRVGQALGAGDRPRAGRAGWAAISLGALFMSCAGLLFLTAPRLIGRMFTTDRDVIEAATSLLAIGAVFQLFDGVQGVATGALRGLGDTRTPMLTHLVSYWLIGLPAGYWLCYYRGWQAAGIWVGFCVSLILIGAVLSIVWRERIAGR